MKNNQFIKLVSLVVHSLFMGGCIVMLFVLVPFWQQSKAEDFLSWFAAYAPNIAKIMLPLEVAPLLFSIFTFFLANKYMEENRKWWLLTILSNIIILLLFFIYFKPANSSMATGTIVISQLKNELAKWEIIHIIRTVLAGLSTLFCILGLRQLAERK